MLEIRDATTRDYPTFATLFRELGVEDPVPPLERFRDDLMATMIVAARDENVVGYAFYRQMKDTVHLAHLVSAPAERRMGIGRALMTEVTRRAQAAGCERMQLNVRPTNTSAIRLYESCGLARVHLNHGLKLDWAMIDVLDGEAVALAPLVRPIEPADEEALETAWAIPRGTFAEQRARPKRVLRWLPSSEAKPALAVFDLGFPGAFPFRAPDLQHALSLLRSLRSSAPEDKIVLLALENQPELATALQTAGAALHMETVFMRGPLVAR